jgi:hypothetical protein
VTSTLNSWGFSLFCDDLRQEVGGKLSVMGIYGADMLFPATVEFPIAIPKFCILVKYYEAKDAFTNDIIIRVFLPGDTKQTPMVALPIQRAHLPPDAGAPYPLDEDQERIFNLTVPLTMAPFQIKQEGFVKVRAVVGETTTRLGSLRIRRLQPDEVMPA